MDAVWTTSCLLESPSWKVVEQDFNPASALIACDPPLASTPFVLNPCPSVTLPVS